jgi:CheY-like chemotaxis protein
MLIGANGCLVHTPNLLIMERLSMFDKPVKLLVVDDDVSIRASLSELFSEIGYGLRFAEDGASALLEIRQDLPDILLSDLNMPGMSGLEFLLTVRRRFPSIRVVAMSGGFSGNCVPPGVAADVFYQKGTGPALLIESVDAVTRPERPTKRLSMEDLFGFQVYETIPPHPGSERLTNSAGQAHYQRLGTRESERMGYSGSGVTQAQEACS